MQKIKVASRKSILAMKQTEIVINLLKEHYPTVEFEIITVNTKGDENLDKKLSQIGSKGLFTYEIEQLLLKGEVDMAVHSLKDMPTDFADNLQISAYIKRHSHKDIIIFNKNYKSIDELHNDAKIGTSSIRREVQLKKINPNFNIANIRGNIHTRLDKMIKENFDAIILAKAGLERLDMLKDINYQELDFVPAVAQGCICVETTKNNDKVISILQSIDDKMTRICVEQEREFLKYMGGSCNIAMGAYCTIKDGKYIITAFMEDTYDEKTIIEKKEISNKFLDSKIIDDKKYIQKISSNLYLNNIDYTDNPIFYYYIPHDNNNNNNNILIYGKYTSDKACNLGITLAKKMKS